MLRTIIAGCDGFYRGREAVSFAASLADATDAGLLLVATFAQPPLPLPESLREHAKQIDRAIRRVRDELAPNARAAAVEALSPAHALRHMAHLENADLIVIGSRHHGRLERFVESDHALQVLHSAPQGVAVVPEGTTVGPQLRNIVVGLDGSREARAAVDTAVALARETGAHLRLLVVLDDRPPASYVQPFDWAERLGDRSAAAHAVLQRTLDDLEDVDVDGVVTRGSPSAELAAAAASSGLLVLGSRRWGPIRRVALGSTADAVVRRGTGPVLVLPRTTHRPGIHAEPPAARATAP
jgi:nucleotide-binding universal stress UspA family protein